MVVRAVEHNIGYSAAHPDGLTDRIRLVEVQSYEIERDNRDLLASISKHQRPREEIIMDSGAALDSSD